MPFFAMSGTKSLQNPSSSSTSSFLLSLNLKVPLTSAPLGRPCSSVGGVCVAHHPLRLLQAEAIAMRRFKGQEGEEGPGEVDKGHEGFRSSLRIMEKAAETRQNRDEGIECCHSWTTSSTHAASRLV